MVDTGRCQERPQVGKGAALVSVETPGSQKWQDRETSTRTEATVEWSQPELSRQIVCTVIGRTGEEELPKPIGTQKIVNESRSQPLSNAARLWFCLSVILALPWSFLLALKGISLVFDFTGAHC